MARVTCAISGLDFSCDNFGSRGGPVLLLPHTAGYFHPIFAASYGELYRFYTHHCKGRLAREDSYLLFLAFLHSSGQIIWDLPATLKPSSPEAARLVENNFKQLVAILEKTNLLQDDRFSQPSFRVNLGTSNLAQIPNWIHAWEENLTSYRPERSTLEQLREAAKKVAFEEITEKLAYHIMSDVSPEEYSKIVADWADRAASFPAEQAKAWKKIITSCFDITAMFKTPLAELKEIREYCMLNIEAGSIHFHTLMKVLNEGISKHIDYLGGSTLALGYTLLPKPTVEKRLAMEEADMKLLEIVENAPATMPDRKDYDNFTKFVKDKAAYMTARSHKIRSRK